MLHAQFPAIIQDNFSCVVASNVLQWEKQTWTQITTIRSINIQTCSCLNLIRWFTASFQGWYNLTTTNWYYQKVSLRWALTTKLLFQLESPTVPYVLESVSSQIHWWQHWLQASCQQWITISIELMYGHLYFSLSALCLRLMSHGVTDR